MGMREIPEVYGVMVVRNRSITLLLDAVRAIITRAAPALGWQIVKNFFTPYNRKRKTGYETLGKKFWLVEDINTAETMQIIRSEKIDLIIRARMNMNFGPALIAAPTMGCVNLHQGLLPEQRGQMCDFWSHAEGVSSGFTLHEMSPQRDMGRIIRRVQVQRSKTSFMEYLDRSSLLELATVRDFLREIRENGGWRAAENQLPIPFRFHKNPTLNDFSALRNSGVKI
jgi:methionyl-tRNA formyltransferase